MWSDVDMNASSCSEVDSGKLIPGSSLLCTFELYNGSSPNPITTLRDVPCLSDRRTKQPAPLFDYFSKDAVWREGSNRIQITKEMTKGIIGEYQLVLSSVTYTVCNGTSSFQETYKGISNDRVCAMNFAVADSYLIHEWTVLSTLSDTNLSAVRYLNGTAVLDRDTLRSIQQSTTASYSAGQIQKIVSSRVDRQTSRAKQSAQMTQLTNSFLKKVPNERVYLYDGGAWREPITLRGGDSSQPVTLIVRNADVIVEWSVAWRNMYIVPDGSVHFKNNSCMQKDIVDGIWISVGWFTTDLIRNTTLGNERCTDGRLQFNWLLIGSGIDASFIKKRRAVLYDWFNITSVSQERKVFDGAAVLLKTDPKIWNNLPPGADAFLKEIKVSR